MFYHHLSVPACKLTEKKYHFPVLNGYAYDGCVCIKCYNDITLTKPVYHAYLTWF